MFNTLPTRSVNRMVCHDSIRYRFSYPVIRYFQIPQKNLRYDLIRFDLIQEYINRYIDIIILLYIPILNNHLYFY